MRSICLFILLLSNITIAQYHYPDTLFRPPMDIPLFLSGTFGELRSNHFHSGMDIKTQGREGQLVYAVGDGYISRIKIQHYGYGKALYIQHPNGHTTVYAHLKGFSKEIEEYVKKAQYEKESYEIELFPKPSDLQLRKGDLIAYSGNTGGSGGPHLHFEIRDANQKPINPMLFGIDIKDSQAPTVLGLFAYPLADGSIVNQSEKPLKININKQADGSFLADKITASGTIGFGVNTYDRQDNTYNKNGVYAVELSVNGSPYLDYDFETFSFDETRYINTLIDYEYYITNSQRVQQCFVLPYNKLSIFNKKTNNGYIDINDGLDYIIEIKVKDFKNNISTIKVPVQGKKELPTKLKESVKTNNLLISGRDNIFEIGKATAFFPQNAFYENLYLDLKENDGIYTIHNDKVPMRSNYTLSIDISDHPEKDSTNLFIAHLSKKGHPGYSTTYRKNNVLSTRTRNLGDFTIMKDSVAPTIVSHNFKDEQWLSNYRYLKLKIYDDLSGIKNYTATIDGKWILTEYEYKENMLTFDFNDLELEGTKHLLEVIVSDNAGNSTTFTSLFFRKQL